MSQNFNILNYLQNESSGINEITGLYKNTIHKNQQTGFTVFTMKVDDNTVVCVGKIQSCDSLYNIPLTLNGYYINDEKYGKQFVFDNYTFSCSEKAEVVSMLKSGIIKGIKYKTACDLADKVIENNITNLLSYFENANTFAKLTELIPDFKKYEFEILQKVAKIVVFEKLFKMIINAGGEYINVLKLITNYDNAYTFINNNVYKAGFFIGLDYQTCDNLAKELKYTDYDRRRAEGLLFFALNMSEEQGNTCTSLSLLRKNIECLQKKNTMSYLPFEYIMSFLPNNKNIKYDYKNEHDIVFYLAKTKVKEQMLAANIRRIESAKEPLAFDENIVSSLETKLGISYAPEQKAAFNSLKTTGIKIITGGPGTGKTTWVNGFINAYRTMYPDNIIKLCSPTGRAAQRMSESTGCFAETFHRLLEYKPYDGGVCKYSSTNRYECDCLIIDEMSMADLTMTSFIFDALKNDVLVILLGDIDQLPSVGCGNILNDLINSNCVEVYRLKTVFRQNGISSIVSNALKINNYETDLIYDECFKVIDVDDDLLAMTSLNDYLDGDCQIFSPVKKGFLGTYIINKYIQNQIRNTDNLEHISYGSNNYYKDDKIMVIKNNYEKGYFNGEVGIITCLSKVGIEVKFEDGREITILNSMLDEITLAYAITVHKSQGSEYKNIVIVLSDDAISLLNKKILYTAVTRAKNKVIILNKNNSLHKCLLNKNSDDARTTFLKDLLQSA